jgi:uncharacterized protein (DUF488 family)
MLIFRYSFYVASQPLFTIGHSNHAAEAFVRLLLAHNIAHLVDVRTFPGSRHHPQFNRPALEAALGSSGISYEWAGQQLGGRTRKSYAQLRQTPAFRNSLKDLIRLSQSRNTVIMCAEEDAFDCHRRFLISRALMEDFAFSSIEHIRKDGTIFPEPGFPESAVQLTFELV